MSAPVWFITGASSGFGLEIAKIALACGHKVIAAARSTARLEPLAALGADIVTLDVTAPEADVRAAVDRAHALHGRLTHVINAAGYILEGFAEEQSADDVRALYDTNVLGVHKVCRAAAPHLRAAGAGTIVTFGSLGSWAGHAACAHYCATKAAVSLFSEGLALELAPFNINVCVIEPGYFRTAFLNPGARLGPTEGPIEAYRTGASGDNLAMLEAANNNQPGDPVRGSQVIFDVLTAEGRDVPVRLIIGSDSVATIRKKCNNTLALADEWETVAFSTDYPK